MIDGFTTAMQVIPAAIGSTIYFSIFIYFLFLRKEKQQENRYFMVFLLSLAAFAFLKPFQLIAQEHGYDKLICNIRYIFLLITGGPCFYLANEIIGGDSAKKKRLIIFPLGFALCFSYIYFNTSTGANQRYSLMTAMLGALIFFVIPGGKRLKQWYSTKKNNPAKSNSLYFALGALLFGLVLMICSGINVFWPLYFGAMPSAMLCAYGVWKNLKEMYLRHDRMVPLIKDELLQDVSVFSTEGEQLEKLLHVTGIKAKLDTVLVIQPDKKMRSAEDKANFLSLLEANIKQRIIKIFGPNRFILIPAGGQRFALCIASETFTQNYGVEELAEDIINDTKSDETTISVGVGERASEYTLLGTSYKQALRSLEFARRSGGSMIAFCDDITGEKPDVSYPESEKMTLLQSVKNGEKHTVEKSSQEFFDALNLYSSYSETELNIELMEIIAYCKDIVRNSGLPFQKIKTIIDNIYKQLSQADSAEDNEKAFIPFVLDLTTLIADMPRERSSELIVAAKKIIEENLSTQLSPNDVAAKLSISSSHFRKVFKDQLGVTFSKYLAELRCEKAKEIMSKTNKSITDISYDLGFKDSNYFSTVFRKHTGQSPRDYKKSLE